jgi:hypothetical protein
MTKVIAPTRLTLPAPPAPAPATPAPPPPVPSLLHAVPSPPVETETLPEIVSDMTVIRSPEETKITPGSVILMLAAIALATLLMNVD